MTLKERIQNEMKLAMKAKDAERLACLRMIKGALLIREKEKGTDASDDEVTAVLSGELKKRRQSLELFEELGKTDEAESTKREIAIIEEFLPRQLTAEELEGKVREYLAANPDVDHPGKLTGALKKELGASADGKLLSGICRKVLDV